jgi:hypothetical protein
MKHQPGPPPPDHGTRSVCTRCNGVGMVTELRVVWKQPRQNETGEALPPLRCSRRVADSDEAAAEIVSLRAAGMIEIDLLSASGPCICRSPAPKTETAPPGAAPDPPSTDPPIGRGQSWDWKRRQAGDDD